MLFGLLTTRGKIFVKWDYYKTILFCNPCPQWMNSNPPYVRKTPLYVQGGLYIKQMLLQHLLYIKQMLLEHLLYIREKWSTSGRTWSWTDFIHGAVTAT